ncbi:MAG: S9 family peptidase [Bacteroidia bacterium]|nr:S9 family peptidase [Bacteroidia bacterium]
MQNFLKRHISLLLFVATNSLLFGQQKSITIEDLWLRNKFSGGYASEIRWMQNDEYYTELDDANKFLIRYSVKTNAPVDTLMHPEHFLDPATQKPIVVQDYAWSDDESKVLLKAAITPIYRRSSKERCYVFDRSSRKTTLLHQGKLISNATFSPNSSKIGFTESNNLFFTDLTTNTTTQITQDGLENNIINGSTDWVYEEEFKLVRAFYWNQDASKIAFLRFDESMVRKFSMDIYDGLYPSQQAFKYPKAGEKNAVVTAFVYDIAQKKTTPVDIGAESDQYIPRVFWTQNPNKLVLLRMNRLQNQLDLLEADATNGSTKVLLAEKSDTYVEIFDYQITFLKKSPEFIWASERDGYNHLYLYSLDGKFIRQITSGNWEITDLLGVDESKKTIYYISTETSPMERQLYSVSLDGKKKQRLSPEAGWYDIQMSSAFSYYIATHSAANQPRSVALFHISGKQIRTFVDKKNLQDKLSAYKVSYPQFMQVPTKDGVMLNAWRILPQNFDSTRKYPVLLAVYGGPGHQTVTNAWGSYDMLWYQVLADKGYIIMSVDNRGTDGRGANFRKITYKNLGKLELEDQIDVAKWLGKQSWVDPQRIGIWGWSYGGFLTSLCLTKGAEYFKMGIAVAPVTNWRYYDTIYTERYLQTPQLNSNGYDQNSPINFAEKMTGKYLLIHGTADDNVHCQNTLEWVNALIKANIQFEMFLYPNRNHGIYGGNTRYHLYTKMTRFITENL